MTLNDVNDHNGSILILRGDEIAALLEGREQEVMDGVADAYRIHAAGDSSLPHSSFLRFPGDDLNRIIALPAYLGGGYGVAGIKWIASFPANVQCGEARASATLILNSTETGQPRAILEGSVISARRTAASAALAAREMARPDAAAAGLVGTGLINFEVARFLLTALPGLRRFVLYDLDRGRAERFAGRLASLADGVEAEVATSLQDTLAATPLTCFATTAVEPHVDDLSPCPPGATVLHVSLRDLTPRVVLECDNVVDDPDHVCRARTSVHLAEQETGGRDFIRCTLADVLDGRQPARRDEDGITVFSPFGLGVLDLALGRLAYRLAGDAARGERFGSFLPTVGRV